MQVDPRKVNLAEADIEQYLWENPQSVWVESEHLMLGTVIHKWIKRQFRVPSGIIDLLGVTDDGHMVVVEIKNVELKAAHITQVKRYAFDIEKINKANGYAIQCIPVLVCPSVDEDVFRECEACGVCVDIFSVSFSIDMAHAVWGEESENARQSQYNRLAQDQTLVRRLSFFDHIFGQNGIFVVPDSEHVNGGGL